MKDTLLAGFEKVDITPNYPVSIIGYFNERISEGILDPLYSRIAAFEKDGKKVLIIEIDQCCLPKEDSDTIKKEIARDGNYKVEDIFISVTHIHTGPSLSDFYEARREEKYYEFLKERILDAVRKTIPNREVVLKISSKRYENLSYNRRWYMKDGKVVTNPPKKHPDRVKPEGEVDRELRVLVFENLDGEIEALFTNISNHSDTIGGNLISADWPGILEKTVLEKLDKDFPIFTLIAPQGNINHRDFDSSDPQAGYEEATRIGKAYADILMDSLKNLVKIKVDKIDSKIEEINVPPREVSEEEIENAKGIVEKYKDLEIKADKLESDDIFKGHPMVLKMFAQNLLDFVEKKRDFYTLPLQIVRLGEAVFFGIPGEPFVEIGLELMKIAKENFNYKIAMPVALANGYFGYIPLEESFERGGYEITASLANPLSRKTANKIIETFQDLLNKIK